MYVAFAIFNYPESFSTNFAHVRLLATCETLGFVLQKSAFALVNAGASFAGKHIRILVTVFASFVIFHPRFKSFFRGLGFE